MGLLGGPMEPQIKSTVESVIAAMRYLAKMKPKQYTFKVEYPEAELLESEIFIDKKGKKVAMPPISIATVNVAKFIVSAKEFYKNGSWSVALSKKSRN